jgi:hypothetical protein
LPGAGLPSSVRRMILPNGELDAETILAAAKICRFCNRDLSAAPV